MSEIMVTIHFLVEELQRFYNVSKVNGQVKGPDPALLIQFFHIPHLEVPKQLSFDLKNNHRF